MPRVPLLLDRYLVPSLLDCPRALLPVDCLSGDGREPAAEVGPLS